MDLQYQTPSNQYPNVEVYATQFAKQLKPGSAIVINGRPLIPTSNDSKLEFQKKWLMAPLTLHQLNSFDCHIIPGTGTFVVNASGKVRFDESGKNKLGETPDLINNQGPKVSRPIWGSWFGFNLNLVLDESVINNNDGEVISSMNYRFTYKPDDSVIRI